MANLVLTLEGVSYVLPDGRTLFSDLHEQFDHRPTGLVGRNGVGKTLLAGILAGQVRPTAGRISCSGRVSYLRQQIAPPEGASVADLAGIGDMLGALERIESGGIDLQDFSMVGEHWDVRLRFRHELERNGLGYLDASTPACTLSGGEATRVAMIGVLLSGADFLILDEPSNHLDRPNRCALQEQLQGWPRGLVLISHDRQLLEAMSRIVELSPQGLSSYGGNYTFYAECKAQERQNAIRQLEQCRLERQRKEQDMRDQQERQQRRQARGKRYGREANQAKILLDRQKERSENSSGKLRQQHSAMREQLDRRVYEAAQQVAEDVEIFLHGAAPARPEQRRLAKLDAVELPFISGGTRHISLTLSGRQRVGVVGPNGCGKSTLLKVLAGLLLPLAGTCAVRAKVAYLDQNLAGLDAQCSVLEQMLAANAVAGEGNLRMRLAQLDLDAHKIMLPSGVLSGGERIKAGLAYALYAEPPAQLLLLDEPNNHLDLPSTLALETMLRSHQGALLVVSHDDAFLNSLGLTERLQATAQGWHLEPW